jgi:DNA-binding NarL/FixJ family response regulator
MTPRIVLLDDHPLFRRGVADLLRAPAANVVGEAADADTAVEQVGTLQPDIVLLDLQMDPGGGTMITKLFEAHPPLRILVLSDHDEPMVRRVAEASGAHGYLSKQAADDEMLAAVHAVWSGERYFELDSKTTDPPGPSLAPRECEVVRGITLGYTNREIADQLDLSIKSVESYRARVMQKLGLSSRAELVRYAFRTGLLDRDSY